MRYSAYILTTIKENPTRAGTYTSEMPAWEHFPWVSVRCTFHN